MKIRIEKLILDRLIELNKQVICMKTNAHIIDDEQVEKINTEIIKLEARFLEYHYMILDLKGLKQ